LATFATQSYRDRKDIALQSAAVSKVQNPNSVVKLKDLQTGEEIVVAFTPGATITTSRNGREVYPYHQLPAIRLIGRLI
jgi:hypothetical protein